MVLTELGIPVPTALLKNSFRLSSPTVMGSFLPNYKILK